MLTRCTLDTIRCYIRDNGLEDSLLTYVAKADREEVEKWLDGED